MSVSQELIMTQILLTGTKLLKPVMTKLCENQIEMSCVMRKPKFWFPTRSDTNQAVQLQKMARCLKFRIVLSVLQKQRR